MATSRNDPRIVEAVNRAMEIAYSKIGTRGGDWVWRAVYPAFVGQAWCGAFWVWVYRQIGIDLMKCAWWYYIPFIKNFAGPRGFLRYESSYGWMPLFDWYGDGLMDHIGGSNPDPESALFRGVEGNTSQGSYGSQDNGNGVWEKHRDFESINTWVDIHAVLAWMIDSGKWDGRISSRSRASDDRVTDLNPNGYSASYIREVQTLLHKRGYDLGPDGIDGILGWKTYTAIGAFQRDAGLEVDHIPGPITLAHLRGNPGRTYTDIRALQAAVGATPDNVSGPDTRKRIDAVRKASTWGGHQFPYGVAYTQEIVGTPADNIWGDHSAECHDQTVLDIQRAVGATPDAIYGPETDIRVNAALAGADQA